MNTTSNPIEEAVRPLKTDAMDRAEQYAKTIIETVKKNLEANGHDLQIVAPYPKDARMGRSEYMQVLATYSLYRDLTVSRAATRGMNDPNYADMSAEGCTEFVNAARENAAFQYEAFIAKLTKKAGPATTATLDGNHVWGHSILTVTKADGGTQRWKTQTIINQSKLGKVFNQFPTRLVK